MTNCWTGLQIFTILEKSRRKGASLVGKKRDIPECEICKNCKWCECHCHWNFSKHAWFFNQEALIELKVNCGALVGDDVAQFAKETKWRLGKKRLGQWVCKADKEDLPLCYYLNPIADNSVHEV